MNFNKFLQIAAAVFLLSGCIGGTPVVHVKPTPYTITPATVTTSYVAGYPNPIYLSGKQTITFVGIAYIKAVADNAIIQSPIVVTPNSDGSIGFQVNPSATALPGHYLGNITVSVCSDSKCNKNLEGSPFKVPYDIEVVSPDGSMTAYNLSPLSEIPGGGDWETFQGNAAHTGYVPVTLNATSFNPRWKWSTPSIQGVQWTPSTITTTGGRLYFSSGPFWNSIATGHELFSYKEEDGSKVWSHSFSDLSEAMTNPPAVFDGKVYIVAGSQQSTAMFAFDASSGTQIFKTPMSSQWEHYLAPTISNQTVYTDGGTYGGLDVFDMLTGQRKFFVNLSQFDGWTPAVDAQFAYVYVGGELQIINIQTGQLTGVIADPNYSWSGYTMGAAPVIGGQGSVFAGNYNNQYQNAIVNFDTVTKTVKWSINGRFSGNPAYSNGVLYASNNLPFSVGAYKESDGSVLWTWTPPVENTRFVSDVLVTNNLVFVSTDTRTYAIDLTTHKAVWSYAASGSLALSINGILYIKGEKSVVAINLK